MQKERFADAEPVRASLARRGSFVPLVRSAGLRPQPKEAVSAATLWS